MPGGFPPTGEGHRVTTLQPLFELIVAGSVRYGRMTRRIRLDEPADGA